jgi:hypothetical protein
MFRLRNNYRPVQRADVTRQRTYGWLLENMPRTQLQRAQHRSRSGPQLLQKRKLGERR